MSSGARDVLAARAAASHGIEPHRGDGSSVMILPATALPSESQVLEDGAAKLDHRAPVMCVLIINWQPGTALPLSLGANRDELRARPWSPPQWRGRKVPVLAPRDERAGGTWLGLNARGLCVAITNGRGPSAEPGWPSRGRLVDELLSATDADQAARGLEGRLASEAWAPFNLLVADRDRAFVHHHSTRDERIELAAGAHVLTNRHDLNPSVLEPARRQVERAAKQGAAALEAEIFALLRDHRSWDETDYAICKHGEHYGTLSSVFLTLEASPHFAFCGTPPCQGRFESYPIEPPEHGS